MKCPACAIDLVMSERSGIEIDYCPTCRGVWLDRGELDKIIERSQAVRVEAPQTIQQGQSQPQPVRREVWTAPVVAVGAAALAAAIWGMARWGSGRAVAVGTDGR